MLIRLASPTDDDAIWAILEPVIKAGETNALPRDMGRAEALAYWHTGRTLVAELGGAVVGTCFIRANQLGGGGHVANAGYMTAGPATGRGVARALCLDSLRRARGMGFLAMQFNFVVSTNLAALHLWSACGFAVVGRLPGAFLHPTLGAVDALVMHRFLGEAA